MKRINPDTGRPFRRGDISPDGKKRFWAYKTAHINKDGFFSINWQPLEKFEEARKKNSEKQSKLVQANKEADLPKRINPGTGKPFRLGERRTDGYFFVSYTSNGRTADGFMGELWMSEAPYFRYRVGLTVERIKKRATERRLSFDLDVDYMLEIYPADGLCPVLGEKMEFGGTTENSPSVDRLIPEKGYLKGNVAWVSKLANVIKSDLTATELRQVASWIERQPIWQKQNSQF